MCIRWDRSRKVIPLTHANIESLRESIEEGKTPLKFDSSLELDKRHKLMNRIFHFLHRVGVKMERIEPDE